MATFFGKFRPDVMSQRIVVNAKGEGDKRTRTVFKEGLSVKEVAKHNNRDDCWLIIEDKVYDLSGWIDKHPGGDILVSYAGRDATDVFEAFHDESTSSLLKNFFIGDVKDLQISDALRAHRQLKKKLLTENYYSASGLYYLYKLFTNISIVSLGIWFCAYFTGSWRILLGGLLVGLFWQQCGWLSHDFLHHQVFKNRRYGDLMGYLVGNVFQGFSVSWWKAKHNLHHACPNVAGFDPDIDTLPFLAWSEKMIEGELDGLPSFLVKNQHLLYWPLLSAARMSWLIQSFLFAQYKSAKSKRRMEIVTLLLHYTWYLAVILFTMSWKEAIAFIIISQASTGLLLSTAFALGHNGMTVVGKDAFTDLDFNELQVVTGRDVSGPGLVHWYMGGLDNQIEHHLFPRIPRHNLKRVQNLVKPICDKYNIHHHTTNFWVGTDEVLNTLYNVSTHLKN